MNRIKLNQSIMNLIVLNCEASIVNQIKLNHKAGIVN